MIPDVNEEKCYDFKSTKTVVWNTANDKINSGCKESSTEAYWKLAVVLSAIMHVCIYISRVEHLHMLSLFGV
jgi:hypothetical protein